MTSQNPTTDDTWTSQDGHCEHCGPNCRKTEDPPWHAALISETESTWAGLWIDGHCPTCAERTRIVAWMHKQWFGYGPSGLADDIERGAHLEGNRG